MKDAKKWASGFTIVELIVVIVVIGILVALVMVSYTAVVNNAHLQQVNGDAETAASTLSRYKADNGAYPSSLSSVTIANTQSTYQYTFNSTNDTYCLTATFGNLSVFIQNGTNTPTQGACPGHGVNGVAPITNVAINPSAEVDLTEVSGYYGSPVTRVAGGAVSGSYIFSTVTNSTSNPQGIIHGITPIGGATPNQLYTCSISLQGTAGAVVYLAGRFYTSSNTYISEGSGQISVTLSSSWQRASVSFTTSPTTGTLYLQYRLATPTSGITIQSDAIMCTTGSTTYNYADGDSKNWVWNGVQGSSTSTGPQL